jgi:hypothetical protein
VKAEEWQRLSELGFDLIEEVQKRTNVGGDKAPAALALVRAALGALLDARAGTISLDDLEAEIEKLRGGLAENDATINAEVDKLFDKGE